jgi:outer membrane biosynthesis protein TonB
MDIIFNAKAVKQKRLEAKKIEKVAKGKSGGTTENPKVAEAKSSLPEESTAPKVSEKATKALTSLRNAGLNSLIGKIAKRANKQGVMVAAVGISADNPNAGRALFSQGTSTTGGGGSAAKEGPSFKLGGIATQGKAGGVGNFKNGTGLAGGSVGAGNVMALSDDEETSIEGGLDRDAIAEVIKRNLGQIRYCYERQLSSNPDLYGKVLVKFVIGADGILAQQKIENSTLKNDMVEGCIMRRMAGWKFPLPKGGTQVRVSYPFLFKALE